MVLLTCCSSEKFMGEGETVLTSVKITSADKNFNAKNYDRYIRQHPNAKWFGLVKVPLGIYCMAGKDTSRHHVLRKLGEAPVKYDSIMSQNSLNTLRNAMMSAGYLNAGAKYATYRKKHKTTVKYTLQPGVLYSIDKITWNVENDSFRKIIKNDSASSLLYKGMP